MRVVAGYDYDRAVQIIRGWPLPEVLQAYLHALREEAQEQHRIATLTWASLAPHTKKKSDPPKLPDILRRVRAD